MFSLLLALVLVSQVGQVDKKPDVSEDLKQIIFGTGLIYAVPPGLAELRTGILFTAEWDQGVCERARKWANYAYPNVQIVIKKKNRQWLIVKVYSAADPWGKDETPMEEVAKEYEDKEVTMKTLNRLLADMRTAYHEYFGEKKK